MVKRFGATFVREKDGELLARSDGWRNLEKKRVISAASKATTGQNHAPRPLLGKIGQDFRHKPRTYPNVEFPLDRLEMKLGGLVPAKFVAHVHRNTSQARQLQRLSCIVPRLAGRIPALFQDREAGLRTG
jgi:hypothetical protein